MGFQVPWGGGIAFQYSQQGFTTDFDASPEAYMTFIKCGGVSREEAAALSDALDGSYAGMPSAITAPRRDGLKAQAIDIASTWARLNLEPQCR